MKIPLLRLNYTDQDYAFISDGIREILQSGHLTMASKVRQFESMYAKWCNVKYAIGTNSGTSSIEIPLRCIGVEGKVVICPSNTFMATPIAAVHAGAKVAFVDCERHNLQMSLGSLDAALNYCDNVGAVILVHIAGIISEDYWKIKSLCDSYHIPVIEDGAHAHGATIDNQCSGSLGLAGSFSFYPTKVLNSAEGGIITTNDEDVYNKSLILREHGKTDHRFNKHSEFGYNWRFSELHALLGIQQLIKADEIVRERRRLASLYDIYLRDVPGLSFPTISSNVIPSYYKYVCFLDKKIDRAKFKKIMLDEFEISMTGEVYSDPCHTQPVFDNNPDKILRIKSISYENTKYVCEHQVCPPLYPGLSDAEIEYVCYSMKNVLNRI